MSIIKSISVNHGDMFYIKHNTDNFTIIDCNLREGDGEKERIVKEVKAAAANKGIKRFISTSPDLDHIRGIKYLSEQMGIENFYVVGNDAKKNDDNEDFAKYCELRDDSKKSFHIYKNCRRKWMNEDGDGRSNSGINVLWPDLNDNDFKEALKSAKEGKPNNISPIFKYELRNGVRVLWMGDLEGVFLEKIKDKITLPEIDVLFAPHHGREIVPKEMLLEMKPKVIIIGEASSDHLNYFNGYQTITQNSAGDITLECIGSKVHFFVSSDTYKVTFLDQEKQTNTHGIYIGTLNLIKKLV